MEKNEDIVNRELIGTRGRAIEWVYPWLHTSPANSQTGTEKYSFQISTNQLEIAEMSLGHIWEHTGWLWSDTVNNRTALAKAPNDRARNGRVSEDEAKAVAGVGRGDGGDCPPVHSLQNWGWRPLLCEIVSWIGMWGQHFDHYQFRSPRPTLNSEQGIELGSLFDIEIMAKW